MSKHRPHGRENGAPKPMHMKSSSVSVNALKTKIRDVTRVLQHAQDLPLDIRIEKERALAGYKQDLEKAQTEKERQRMIKKYHMVRFFERQKATRNLKKLRKRLAAAATDSPERRNLETQIHSAEVDLNYAMYHPLDEKYISLYPNQETERADGETGSVATTSKPAMWATVEKSMANGSLQALRDGKLRTSSTASQKPIIAKPDSRHARQNLPKSSKSRDAQAESPVVDEEEDASDGGFFEE
ncbi:MAG: hypothetical protein Q9222_005454 [Ikaeria aurantiellina]